MRDENSAQLNQAGKLASTAPYRVMRSTDSEKLWCIQERQTYENLSINAVTECYNFSKQLKTYKQTHGVSKNDRLRKTPAFVVTMTGKCECKMCKKCKMQRNVETVACVFQAWNPASEEQCIDRCHRLGQTRKVVVTKVSQRKATITFDAPLRFVCISDCSVSFTLRLHFLLTATVYCERLGGGEDGGDPEEEAGPVGEGLRLLEQRQENVTDQ